MIRYVAFDLEISKPLPDDVPDWKAFRPLGISCAATLTNTGDLRLWHSETVTPDGMIGERMSPAECQALTHYLAMLAGLGVYVISWNGAAFDFDVLAEECASPADAATCRALATGDQHIDMGFAMLCDRGYLIGLQAAARGLGLQGKTAGMHGDLAPAMWAESREAQDRVLEYVAQDATTTAEVFEAIAREGCVPWISKAGRPNKWAPDFAGENGDRRMLSVPEALALPRPDTSWMRSRRTREECLAWTVR